MPTNIVHSTAPIRAATVRRRRRRQSFAQLFCIPGITRAAAQRHDSAPASKACGCWESPYTTKPPGTGLSLTSHILATPTDTGLDHRGKAIYSDRAGEQREPCGFCTYSGLFSLFWPFQLKNASAGTIASCVSGGTGGLPPFNLIVEQTCTLYELAPGDDGIPPMQQLLFPTIMGYLILCSTGCDSGIPPSDTAQWSDVVAFQNGLEGDQAFVQIFPAPFSQHLLAMVLPCITFSVPGCQLPGSVRVRSLSFGL